MDLKILRKKGVLIVFEGISGCGKSEEIKKLSNDLDREGYEFSIIEWNSNKNIQKIVKLLHRKDILNSTIYSLLQWISFCIGYYRVIRPCLNKNRIVIGDRYIYTGITRDKVNKSYVYGKILHKFVRSPDIVFYHNVCPNVCYERIKKRKKKLFHTNKQILKNTKLKEKNLYYLKKLNNEYLRIFKDLKLNEKTNLIYLDEKTENVSEIVKKYLSVKMHKSSKIFKSCYNKQMLKRGDYLWEEKR